MPIILTLANLQDQIHALVEGDPDTPDTDDDDYIYTTRLINQSISQWENEKDCLWQELWTTNSAGGTVTAGDSTYSAPADFKMPGGFIRFDDGAGNVKKLQVMSPEDAQLYELSDQFCYFTGNPKDGYVLNLNFTPATGDGYVGTTIKYDYYKFASSVSSASDEVEMADPSFIVYRVAAQRYLQRRNIGAFQTFDALAQNALDMMKMQNAAVPNWQNGEIVDIEAGFGV
jgi:hypothetical protein